MSDADYVQEQGGKWYWWDEAYNKYGPYNTKQDAQNALDKYVKEELG